MDCFSLRHNSEGRSTSMTRNGAVLINAQPPRRTTVLKTHGFGESSTRAFTMIEHLERNGFCIQAHVQGMKHSAGGWGTARKWRFKSNCRDSGPESHHGRGGRFFFVPPGGAGLFPFGPGSPRKARSANISLHKVFFCLAQFPRGGEFSPPNPVYGGNGQGLIFG